MLCFGLSKASKAKKSKASMKTQPAAYTSDSDDDDGMLSNNWSSTREVSREGPCKLFVDEEMSDNKLVAVLVSIFSGSSYDEMFRENQPTTVPGERVSTYSLDCSEVENFNKYLAGSTPIPSNQTGWRQLIDDINLVAADSVTLNWECCSGCGNSCFPSCGGSNPPRRGLLSLGTLSRTCANQTMELMGLALRRGFTVMCSDFSLKALINEWSEDQLGPNPFVNMGSCSSQFQLDFVPGDLQHEDVPQQLQVVGELCAEHGKAVVTAMSDTIVYTVNPRRSPTNLYSLKVLTVVTNYDGASSRGHDSFTDDGDDIQQELGESQQTKQNMLPEAMMCSVGEGDGVKSGMAGHVALTYASGGQLVTSMGHWIELTRIDTSLDGVLRVAQHNFGSQELAMLQEDLGMQSTERDREECVQKWAKKHISQSVPSRMKCRTKY